MAHPRQRLFLASCNDGTVLLFDLKQTQPLVRKGLLCLLAAAAAAAALHVSSALDGLCSILLRLPVCCT